MKKTFKILIKSKPVDILQMIEKQSLVSIFHGDNTEMVFNIFEKNTWCATDPSINEFGSFIACSKKWPKMPLKSHLVLR